MKKFLLHIIFLVVFAGNAWAQGGTRLQIPLEGEWLTVADDTLNPSYDKISIQKGAVNGWKAVTIPHNWDTYHGIRRMKHGNLHGYAWYRHQFEVPQSDKSSGFFLFFEGVGSYATIFINGRKVGEHAGGRTTFTLDVTAFVTSGLSHLLTVKVGHPAGIKDLPWVCGGCSNEIGFSEGSQPMGIFRPVSLVITNLVRIEPFGQHIWNDTTVNKDGAVLHASVEVKNYGPEKGTYSVIQQIIEKGGKKLAESSKAIQLNPGEVKQVKTDFTIRANVHLWSLENPYLYLVVSQIYKDNKLVDTDTVPYGIRWVKWPEPNDSPSVFLLNGKPVFINGTAEYEHILGNSHAFSPEQIAARVSQVRAAGYNAFRDAHQPHNLRYQQNWDSLGILWWPQMAAHVWFDNEAFKNNFKRLLIQWVKERRNSPSNILWGLENESTLPEAFARECSEIIRQLDPTATIQRKITTCNGGSGTDWDVPQNWTGTYGGDPATYDRDIQRQVLIGEYGAWRTTDLHSEEEHYSSQILSEERMTRMMETKLRLAEKVKHNNTGHFHWLLYSHENPGRTQSGEGVREIDRIGPVNYKGLFTLWGEPTDVFYMYRSNYVSPAKEPMVYISSHTWPDRWTTPGIKNNVVVYSNCDSVALFNGNENIALGVRHRGGPGTHFRWNGVDIQFSNLIATGYVNGKVPARDSIFLHHLPSLRSKLKERITEKDILQPDSGMNYLFRINCGGPAYTDTWGNKWLPDIPYDAANGFGSISWTADFKGIHPAFASQRYQHRTVGGTKQDALFQYYRFGQNNLSYKFDLPNGNYLVSLFFEEPWYGVGGGLNASGWRIFDVAINGETRIKGLDIFKESGTHRVLLKKVPVRVKDGKIEISFPQILAGQAIISAIAVASAEKPHENGKASNLIFSSLIGKAALVGSSQEEKLDVQYWLQTGQTFMEGRPGAFLEIPSLLYGAEWVKFKPSDVKESETKFSFMLKRESDVWIGISSPDSTRLSIVGIKGFADAGLRIRVAGQQSNWWLFKKRMTAGENLVLPVKMNGLPLFAAATPVTTIDPGYDLKPTVSFRYDKTLGLTAGVKRDSVNGRQCLCMTKESGDTIVWPFTVGVADMYALRFRYVNRSQENYELEMLIRAADGTVMKRETLKFEPYLPNKWGLAETNSGTTINAGNYTITLVGKNAKGLCLSTLEVQ